MHECFDIQQKKNPLFVDNANSSNEKKKKNVLVNKKEKLDFNS